MRNAFPASTGSAAATPDGAAALRWPPMPALLRQVVERLPVLPPSIALAAALNRLLLPRLSTAQRTDLARRPVEIRVSDLGLRFVLVLDRRGFEACSSNAACALSIRADAASLLRLASGEDDADRLFFERRLVMEGDTEFGLVMKNTLDALGPLLPQLARRR